MSIPARRVTARLEWGRALQPLPQLPPLVVSSGAGFWSRLKIAVNAARAFVVGRRG